ncbi:TIGR02391 family protein [bacterium]|nr:TIGR02391 family protein [bacterium]
MIPSFSPEILEAVCKILGDTGGGFTGGEIGRLLAQCQIADPGPLTKWRRLFQAFSDQQVADKCGNKIGVFLENAMSPARYLQEMELFENRKAQLNQILSLSGLSLNGEGKLTAVSQTKTVQEALQKSSNLKLKLQNRGTHSEVFKYCLPELVAENYFHAVFEATKGVLGRLREKTGLTDDGVKIIDQAFAIDNPMVAINTLRTKSEQAEHKGFANLLKGVYGFIRNPLAHEAKLNWQMDEQDALDSFALISLIHRRLDKLVVIPQYKGNTR